jgi:limonene-1,2-epoxide hydrolase
MSEQIKRNQELATRVCEGWSTFSREDFGEVFAPDVEYRNMPLPEVQRGPDAIYEVLRRIPPRFEVRLKLLHLLCDERVAMAERLESFTPRQGGESFDLPVLGIFEFAGGKIRAWRDYFDLRQWKG